MFICGIASAQPVTGNVTANPLWTDTGIAVTNGEWINVNASGFWYWPAYNDPDGYLDHEPPVYEGGDLWVADNLQGQLVAYVGINPYIGTPFTNGVYTTNEYWAVGTAGQFMSTTNGELWLGINDDAYSMNIGDNSGSIVATVATNFDTNFISNPVTLTITQVTTNQFSFFISNGVPNTVCAIYDSADLVHWTLIDSIVLDGNGTSASATDNNPPSGTTGLQSGDFVNNTGVPYRFYKVTDGQFVSRTIGFCNLWIGPGTTNAPGTNSFIANQFDEPNGNTLDGIFDPANQISGELPLPTGTIIAKWDATGGVYDYYTWSGSTWGGSGGITLNPGEGAFLANPTSNPILVTFAGLVREGTSSLSVNSGSYILVSSILPKAGLIQDTLGYIPNFSDLIETWNGSGFQIDYYLNHHGTPEWISQPILTVGEGFFISPAANNIWNEYYSSHQF